MRTTADDHRRDVFDDLLDWMTEIEELTSSIRQRIDHANDDGETTDE